MKRDIKPDLHRDARPSVEEGGHHPLFPPSGAHRWLHCTASPQPLSRGYQGTVTEASAEGTFAHTVFAQWLTHGAPQHERGKVYESEGYRFKFDDEMHGALERCVDFIEATEHADLGRVLVQQVEVLTCAQIKFDEGHETQEVSGHGDVVQLIQRPDGRMLLRVSDLKYGKGVRVFAGWNPQLMLYALGAVEVFDALLSEEYLDSMLVELNVLQPRLDHFDTWHVGLPQLKQWADDVVAPAVAEVHGLGKGPSFRPSESVCRWCPLKGDCAAAQGMVANLFAGINDDPYMVTPAKLGEFLDRLPFFEQIAKAARERAQTLLMSGDEVPGWKLVAGRSARGWDPAVEELTIADALRACDIDPFTRTLTSVAAAEKQVGAKVFAALPVAEMVVKPEGRPTLAPESDKRAAVTPADGSIFNDESETNE